MPVKKLAPKKIMTKKAAVKKTAAKKAGVATRVKAAAVAKSKARVATARVKKSVANFKKEVIRIPKFYSTRFFVLGILLFIFVAWLIVALVSLGSTIPSVAANKSTAVVNAACSGDPLVTIPDCIKK